MTIDTIDAGKLIGKAVATELGQALAALPSALAAELADKLAPVLAGTVSQLLQPHVCATCLARRVSWEKANGRAVQDAFAAAQAASAADFTQFLPERLRAAGVPNVKQAMTTCRGTDVCAEHVETGAPLVAATVGVPPGALGRTQ